MRCGEKRFIVETSDGGKHQVSARTQVEARKKAKEICRDKVTIHSVQKWR